MTSELRKAASVSSSNGIVNVGDVGASSELALAMEVNPVSTTPSTSAMRQCIGGRIEEQRDAGLSYKRLEFSAAGVWLWPSVETVRGLSGQECLG